MRCSKCGKYFERKLKYWKYCPYCGAEVPDEVIEHFKSKHVAMIKLLVTIIVAVLLVAVGVTVAIISHNKDKLTKQEAQEIIDITLSEVYQEAAPDNFIVQMLEKTVEIHVDSVKQTKDGAFANCTVTSLDLATPILEYMQSLDPGSVDAYENVTAGLIEAISDAQEIEEDFKIEFILTNGEYTPVFSEELVVFCSGNVQELLSMLYTVLQGGVIE